MKKALLFLLFLLSCARPSWATYYYVAAGGDDDGDGLSPETAFRTVAPINNLRFLPGDVISFHGGDTFTGPLRFSSSDSGTSVSPVLVTSYGERATITGNQGIVADNVSWMTVQNLSFVGVAAHLGASVASQGKKNRSFVLPRSSRSRHFPLSRSPVLPRCVRAVRQPDLR